MALLQFDAHDVVVHEEAVPNGEISLPENVKSHLVIKPDSRVGSVDIEFHPAGSGVYVFDVR